MVRHLFTYRLTSNGAWRSASIVGSWDHYVGRFYRAYPDGKLVYVRAQ